MKTFYITFGRTGIRNGWVRVEARDELIARAWARREYGLCWSGIYDESEWSANREGVYSSEAYYPAGELAFERLFYEDASHV